MLQNKCSGVPAPQAKIPGSARRMMGDCIGKHKAGVSRFCKISPAIGWEMEERPWDTTCVYVVEEPGAVRGVPLSDPVAEDQLLCGRDLQRSHQYWQQWDSAMGQSENIIGLSQQPSQIKSILHKMNWPPDTVNRWTNEARFNWSPFHRAKNGSPLPQKSGSNWHWDQGEKILLALDRQLLRGGEPTFEINQQDIIYFFFLNHVRPSNLCRKVKLDRAGQRASTLFLLISEFILPNNIAPDI